MNQNKDLRRANRGLGREMERVRGRKMFYKVKAEHAEWRLQNLLRHNPGIREREQVLVMEADDSDDNSDDSDGAEPMDEDEVPPPEE